METKVISGLNEDAYAALIEEMLSSTSPPEGAISKRKLAKDLGLELTGGQLRAAIKNMIDAGRLENVGQYPDGGKAVTFYRVIPKQ